MKVLAILLVLKLATANIIPVHVVKPLNGACSNTLTGDGGTFNSPNFPENYGNNANCSWLIITGSNTMITLRFDTFLVEANADFVQIYDGATSSATQLASYSGFAVPAAVTSTSNVMYVVFTSNSVLSYAGFQARYESSTITTPAPTTTTTVANNCGGIQIGAGLVQSPNHPQNYPDNIDCTWYLQSNRLTAASLDFQSFVTETKVDQVTVWEGWNPATTTPSAIYSGTLTPFSFSTSNTNKITVKFQSDASLNYAGFRANFS